MPKRVKCYLCHEEVSEDFFCSGCQHYICEYCSGEQDITGRHDVTDHAQVSEEY